MKTENSLFRKESVEAQKIKWLGEVIHIKPFSSSIITLFVLTLIIIFVSFISLFSYTKKSTAGGQIVPEQGINKSYSLGDGIIKKIYVKEGDYVKENDILLEIESNKNLKNNSLYGSLIDQLKSDQDLLTQEIERKKSITNNECDGLELEIQLINNQINHNEKILSQQLEKLNITKTVFDRYNYLLKDNAVSKESVDFKKMEYIDQKYALKSIEKDQALLNEKLNQSKVKLKNIRNESENEISLLSAQYSEKKQKITELIGSKTQIIKASSSGIVTALNVSLGNNVSSEKLLFTIIPNKARLIAYLYLSSSQIGFIKDNSNVILRYDSYPYQKFGHGTGRVISISRTALPNSDLNSIGTIPSFSQFKDEPIYLVKVTLDKQSIKAYGKEKYLQPGMLLEADIIQDHRKIYEWILEPITTITGKI